MVQLNFTNVRLKDVGYGLEINGQSLEDILSAVLGVREMGDRYHQGDRTGKDFEAQCANLSLTIDVLPVKSEVVFTDDPEMGNEECRLEDYLEHIKKTEPDSEEE